MKLAIPIAVGLFAACHSEDNLGLTQPLGTPRWAIVIGGADETQSRGLAVDSIGDVVVVGDNGGPADFGTTQVAAGGGFITKRAGNDGSERWTVPLHTTGDLSFVGPVGVAVAPDGSIVVTGDYYGSVDFGGQTLTLGGTGPVSADTFIAKYAADGHLVWVRGLATMANLMTAAIAVDSAGRIVVTGSFVGTLSLGGTSYDASNDSDTYVASVDPAGTLLWSHALQGPNGPWPSGIAIAPNDDVVIVGWFGGLTSMGGRVIESDGTQQAFVTRFRDDGLFLSALAFGTGDPGASQATQVAVDATGLVFVQTSETSVQSTGSALYPWFNAVHAFADDDQELWAVQQTDQSVYAQNMRTLAILPNGSILSSAWDDQPSDQFNGVTNIGSMNVARYDRDGSGSLLSFGKRLLGPPSRELTTTLWASATTATGAIAFAGSLAGVVDFGLGPMTTHDPDQSDALVLMVDPN